MADELTSERWGRIGAILEELLDAATPEKREQRLETVARDDPQLAARLRSLLEAEARPGILDQPVGDYLPTLISELHRDGSSGSDAGESAQEPERFLPGTMIAGRYRIATRLGAGGMGEVFRADDLRLGQAVALKFLPVELSADADLNARLLNEIKLARQISHPNVCRIFDVGEDDGLLFCSMELVEGEDLASLLRRIGRLPREKAAQIARQLCSGLGAAHDRGILHRDLKPANVMLDDRGQVRITDFGLAGHAAELGRGRSTAGTPAYMAPEQLVGGGVTRKSDLYALGIVLYELFTGRRPYRSRSRAELLQLQHETTPPAPSSWVEGLDPAIEKAILQCLEADPANRPASALEVAAALPGADPLAAALAAGETPSPELVAAAGPSGLVRPRSAFVALALLLAALLLAPALVRRASVVGLVPWSKPAAALASDAEELLRDLGYEEPPVDRAWRFDQDSEYLDHLARADASSDRWRALEHPGQLGLRFVYRRASRFLLPASWSGRVVNLIPGGVSLWEEPAPEAGDVLVVTDLRGRLRYLRAVSIGAQSDSRSLPDHRVLFERAGLDLATFRPIEPVGALPVHAERRFAWQGRMDAGSELDTRVEAGFVGDRPVFFECVHPYRRASVQAGEEPGTAQDDLGLWPLGAFLWPLFLGSVIVVPGILALRNLRLGRGDRRGATRLAIALLLMRFVWWLLAGHHVADGWGELYSLLGGAAARCAYVAAAAWVVYVAVEPHARRLWPEILIGWSRLLEGRWSDPMVGRDVLFGSLIGVLTAPLHYLYFLIPRWMSWPEPPTPMTYPLWAFFAPSADPLLGASHAVAAAGSALMGAVWASMGGLAILILALGVVRRRWLALALVVLFTGLNHWAVGFSDQHWLGIVIGIFGSIVFSVSLVRFGLLAMVATIATTLVIWTTPLTDEPGSPHFGVSLFLLALMAAPSVYAAHSALGGLFAGQRRGA